MSAPPVPSVADPARVRLAAAQLTLEEKASLTGGRDVWHLPSIDRLGIGALKMSDGPSGIRGERIGRRRSLAFACGTAAGATWDVDLLGLYGAALGAEARSKGVDLVLGPTVGIPRTPLGGRTFESFAEDPHLSARLAVAYIRGVQDQGVGCCVKHFACNDQEHERMTISAEVDARALREIHLVPFEAAVREAGAWAVMAAYNKLNGTYCSEHAELLDRILRDEWGFDGVVVSDWYGTHSTVGATTAGLDVEMPGPAQYLGAALAAAVARGDVDPAVLDQHARRVLRLLDRCGRFDRSGTTEEEEEDDPGRRLLARELVVGSTVLLKNRGLLPLTSGGLRKVAVIGPNARWIRTGGGGSSAVTPLRDASLLDELRGQLPGVDIIYEEGCRIDRGVPPIDPRLLSDGFDLDCYAGRGFDGEPVATEHITTGEYITIGDPMTGVDVRDFSVRACASFTPDASGAWQLALANTGTARLLVDGDVVVDNAEPSRGTTFFGYGSTVEESEMVLEAGRSYELLVEFRAGRTPVSGFQVRAARPVQEDSLARAVDAARGADAVVVVVGSNGQWETEGNDRVDLRLAGEQDELIRQVALANPKTVVVINAGAPVEMPWVDDVAAILMLWFPGEEGAPALARMLTGAAEPTGRLPITFPRRLEDSATRDWYPGADGKVEYGEGTLVGYRHFDAHEVEPLFCFGHGLSYTSFSYGELTVALSGRAATITLEVTNTGPRRGSEVVQLYVGDVEAGVPRAKRELKAFQKLTLDPGERRSIELRLDERSFAYWDPDGRDWVVEPGSFDLAVGRSSRDLRQVVRLEVG